MRSSGESWPIVVDGDEEKTAFRIVALGFRDDRDRHGGAFTLLHSFMGGSDGSGSTSGLIADSKGTLFGTTPSGGASDDGTVYKLSGTGFVPEP